MVAKIESSNVPTNDNYKLEVNIPQQEPPLPDGSIRVVSGSGFRYVTPFPWRLHEMLDDMEATGETNIVSWLPDGRTFKVHDPQAFTKKIVPKWFKHKCYKSFQRQLHLYGFRRVQEGQDKGKKLEKRSVLCFRVSLCYLWLGLTSTVTSETSLKALFFGCHWCHSFFVRLFMMILSVSFV